MKRIFAKPCPVPAPDSVLTAITFLMYPVILHAGGGEGHLTSTVDHLGDPLPNGAIARLGTSRLRQANEVGLAFSAVFGPDGKTFASTGEPALIHLWNADTGKEVGRLRNPEAWMYLLTYSPSGRSLAASEWKNGHQVILWDLATSKISKRFKPGKGMAIAAEFLDEKTLVTVGWEGVVQWWDISSARLTKEWPLIERKLQTKARPIDGLMQASFSRDGRILAAGRERIEENPANSESVLLVYDLMRKKELCRFNAEEAKPYQFFLSADGSHLAALVGKYNEGATLWRVATREKIFEVPQGDQRSFQAVALDRTGGRLVAASDRDVRIWNTGTKQSVSTGIFTAQRAMTVGSMSSEASGRYCPKDLFFSSDDARLFIGLGNGMALWDVHLQKEVPHFSGHRNAVTWVAYSTDGQSLCSGEGGDWRSSEEVIAWDTSTYKLRHRSRQVGGYPWSPDHSLRVMHKESDGRLFVQDTRSGKNRCELDLRHDRVYIPGGFFSPDKHLVAMPLPVSQEPAPLVFMDTRSGKRLGVVRYPPFFLDPLVLSNDNKLGAWHNGDATIQVQNLATDKQVWKLGEAGMRSTSHDVRPTLTFSPDGRHLASWEPNVPGILVWDLTSGRQFRRFAPGRSYPDGFCRVATFSPDGRLLGAAFGAANHAETTVQLWELNSGRLRREFRGHSRPIDALAFSPDGRHIASGSLDTTVLVWDLYALEKPIKSNWSAAEAESLWADLVDADTRRAGHAVAVLIHSPGQAESLFGKYLQRVRPADENTVSALITDLERQAFAVRDKANRELAKLDDLAGPALRKSLSKSTSLEFRRRVERLLEDIENTATPRRLREARAMEVLEVLGTPTAQRLLEELAAGASEARVTQDARATLQRLQQRASIGSKN